VLMRTTWRHLRGASLFALGALSACAGELPQSNTILQTGGSPTTLQLRSYRDIPFRTVVRQQYDYSCGSAALATLLRFHYGQDIDEADVFKAMFVVGDQETIRKVGFSLLDMRTYLESIGMRADGFRISFDTLQQNALPVITVITVGKYRHFVVIKGVTKEKVLVGDPALGLKTYTRDEFAKMWNGISFLIRDSKTKAAFNMADEWTPWSRAPIGDRLDRQSLYGVNVQVAPVYQVLQLTALQPNSP
jgi:predicted double-glycine peptidase